MYTTLSPVYRYMASCSALLGGRQFPLLCSYEAWRVRESISSYTQDDAPHDGTKWLMHSLLRVVPFTEDVYDALVHLAENPMTPQDWGALFGERALCGETLDTVPLSTVQWLVERGVVIDWNTSRATYPALYRALHHPKEESYVSFLIQEGAHPDLYIGGMPLLLFYLDTTLSSPRDNMYHTLIRRVRLLLEHGADPLLGDKEGRTAMDMVRHARIPLAVQQELLAVVESWTER